MVKRAVPLLIALQKIDLVIANAENASAGSGWTGGDYGQIREAGVDLVTLGDHIYKKQEFISVLEKDDHVCKPANFPADAPGREMIQAVARDGTPVPVFCLLGRTFMRPLDCPFQAADPALQQLAAQSRSASADLPPAPTAPNTLL